MNEVNASWPIERAEPESVGLSSGRLDRIKPVIERYISDGSIAGAITLVVRRNRIAHLACAGMADLARRTPMRQDAIFRIYSMTTLITSAAVLMLMEEGHFVLKEPVKKFLPEFADLRVSVTGADGKEELVRPRRDITTHDLLTHTAGLTYQLPQDVRTSGWNLAQFVHELCKQPLKHQPGITWDYSFATDVLGRLVEVVSGKSFDQFLKERVGAACTQVWIDPAEEMISMIMMQLRPAGKFYLMDIFKNLAAQAIVD